MSTTKNIFFYFYLAAYIQLTPGPSWVNANNCAVLTRTPWSQLGIFANNCEFPSRWEIQAARPRTIVRSGRNSESRHRTIWRGPGLCCCPKYRTIQARPARKPNTPETRWWTPDPTRQV